MVFLFDVLLLETILLSDTKSPKVVTLSGLDESSCQISNVLYISTDMIILLIISIITIVMRKHLTSDGIPRI
jgi:hypothetical protein